MEDSCPATPLVLTGRNSKSPLQVALSSPESDGMKSPSRDSPDSRCVICLGRLQNKSFTDSCLHQFCFQCLLQWSKIKAECPLCKQPFKSIIHNVRSNLDYDQYHLEHGEPHYVLSDFMHSYNFEFVPVDRRFRYRSTMTREYFRELAESFFGHTRRLPEDSYQINPLVPVDPAPNPSIHRSSHLQTNSSQQRMRQRGTTDFRRNIYAQDLWVQDLADISGRYRECTPQFYRENPAQIHRIIPWLNREVNVLLSDCESHAAYVLSRIISLLTQYPVRSREFREQVQSYFGDRTDHFIHELFTFARSVYDIAGFDQNAIYGTNPNYATEVQEISSSSDNGSDIEVLETVKSEDRTLQKSSRQGLKKLLLKRVGCSEPKSDEPVAGPSGITSVKTSDSIDICESDSEEIKVLEFVKPEPEIVTLSSGEEAPAYSDLDISNGEYAEVIHSENNKLRRSSSHEDEKKRSRSRITKGKCKSNGFGLKGKQKRKYIKSRRHRSSSNSSTSSGSTISSDSSSSSSSSSSMSSSSSSSSSSSNISKSTSYENKRRRSVSSLSSRSSHKSSNKSKRKKSKSSRKKIKKKVSCKSSHKKHKSSSDAEKKKKRVKSCVIVPSWSCDSSSSVHKGSSRSSNVSKSLKSYWSIALNDRSRSCRESPYRKSKRKHRDNSSDNKMKKRNRNSSSSSERIVYCHNSYNKKSNTSNCKTNTSYDSLLPGSGDISSSYGIPSSSSSRSFALNSSSQNFYNSD